MIVCPVSDPGFADHPMHGHRAQRDLIRRAVKHCSPLHRRTAVDAGAHIGLCSLELATVFSVVMAFEPVEENFACYQSNTYEVPNIVGQRLALGAYSGYFGMRQHAANSGCWQIDPSNGNFDAPTDTLDSFGMYSLDFLKIDVEGMEGGVIQGAEETIKRCRPVILFEDNGVGKNTYKDEWVDPKPLLTELGYRKVERINKDEVWCYR